MQPVRKFDLLCKGQIYSLSFFLGPPKTYKKNPYIIMQTMDSDSSVFPVTRTIRTIVDKNLSSNS